MEEIEFSRVGGGSLLIRPRICLDTAGGSEGFRLHHHQSSSSRLRRLRLIRKKIVMVWSHLLCGRICRIGVGGLSFAARCFDAVGRRLTGPHDRKIFAPHGRRVHLGLCPASLCECDLRTSCVWNGVIRRGQYCVGPGGVGGAEYTGQSDCRVVAALVLTVRDRRLRATDRSGGCANRHD